MSLLGPIARKFFRVRHVLDGGESVLLGFTGTSGGANSAPRAFSLNGHASTLV